VVIANLFEKLLLVVEAGVTTRTMARAALRRLTSVKVKPLGVIFNKMKNDPLGYGYDYYYYYAHGYYGYGEDGKKNNKNKPKKSKFI
jgi:Mrp family chromosome partitioning ATPase